MNPHTIAKALGGEVVSGSIVAPGPGHGPRDRSLSVKLEDTAPDGFVVHSFAGDDPLACKDHVRDALGLPSWQPSRADPKPVAKASRVVARYTYTDADGAPVMRVVRREPKAFSQEKAAAGGGWEPGGVSVERRVPYRLSDVLEAIARGATVYVVEGEKTANRMANAGLAATCSPGGAGKWPDHFADYFTGADVVILPDNDEPGEAHAVQVKANLEPVAASVRIVRLPGLPPKGDPFDWLEAGNSGDEIAGLPDGGASASPARPASFSAADLQSMKFEPIKYVVPGCHLVEGLTILASKPKLGKSWFMLQSAIAVALGEIIFEQRCQPGDVLYCALEDNPRRLQSRMDKLCGKRAWPPRLTFRCEMPGLAEGGLDAIRDWASEVEAPRLVIIDVLAKVRPSRGREEGNYEADYRAVSGLKALADELGLAIVLVHHVRKMDAEDPLDTVSGTTGLTGAVDSILVLSRGGDGVTLQGRGRDITEVDAAVRFDPQSCRWSYLGEATEVRRSDERRMILDVLLQSREPMSPREITDATDHSYQAVRALLTKMARTGEVIKTARGSYLHPDHNGHTVTTDHDEED